MKLNNQMLNVFVLLQPWRDWYSSTSRSQRLHNRLRTRSQSEGKKLYSAELRKFESKFYYSPHIKNVRNQAALRKVLDFDWHNYCERKKYSSSHERENWLNTVPVSMYGMSICVCHYTTRGGGGGTGREGGVYICTCGEVQVKMFHYNAHLSTFFSYTGLNQIMWWAMVTSCWTRLSGRKSSLCLKWFTADKRPGCNSLGNPSPQSCSKPEEMKTASPILGSVCNLTLAGYLYQWS